MTQPAGPRKRKLAALLASFSEPELEEAADLLSCSEQAAGPSKSSTGIQKNEKFMIYFQGVYGYF